MKDKYIMSTWKRAIYIGPPANALTYGMTGYFDPDFVWFIPDTDNGRRTRHVVSPDYIYLTE